MSVLLKALRINLYLQIAIFLYQVLLFLTRSTFIAKWTNPFGRCQAPSPEYTGFWDCAVGANPDFIPALVFPLYLYSYVENFIFNLINGNTLLSEELDTMIIGGAELFLLVAAVLTVILYAVHGVKIVLVRLFTR